MPSLKDLRSRIASVKATQKITKALQMVAAAKLRRATQAAESARPYARRMASVIANLSSGVSGADAPPLLVGTGRDDKHLIVVMTADRGLAGGFNSAVVRAARERIFALDAAGKQVRVATVGRKARDMLRRQLGERMIESVELGKAASVDLAQPVADLILREFEAGRADVVTLFYSRYRSVVSQVPTAKQLIPAVVEEGAEATDLKGAVYTYEPDEQTILETLLPRNVMVQVLAAMFETHAGFFAANMTATDNATRNAGDMINKLTLQYNRSRQAQITKELIEIISGAEAL